MIPIQGNISLINTAGYNVLTAASDYTGNTAINGGTLVATSMADGGTASAIGSSSNAAGNLLINGGILKYTGAAATTDRLFTLGNSGGTLNGSGTGALQFLNTGNIAFANPGVASHADPHRLDLLQFAATDPGR